MTPSAWSRLTVIARPFFSSSLRWRVAGAIALIVILFLGLNALNVANSYVGRNFMTAISERNRDGFLRYAVAYLLVFAASATMAVSAQFVQDRLALAWRSWLTANLLGRYLSGSTSAAIRLRHDIDNPDQRITEDVRTFTASLLGFAVMLMNAALTTISFAGVLWSIAPRLLVAAILYAAVGSLATIRIGRRLVALDAMQLRKEADLRHAIIQVRERPEARSARADESQARRLMASLRRVVHNSRAIIGVSRNVNSFTSGYNYLVPILPVMLVAPLYLRGELELGVVTQSAMAFAQLLGAFSLIIVQFQSIAAFTAVVHRIGALWETMENSASPFIRPSLA